MRITMKSDADKMTEFDDRVERLCRWHKMFMWKPTTVVINDQPVWVWLSFIGRKCKVRDTIHEQPYIDDYKWCNVDDVVVNALKDNDIHNTCESYTTHKYTGRRWD